ncbi:signal peptidase II [Microbacterium sp. 2P01SA-2]|uniref:signal peptidase II n=1 Tax=unclassified Microbacterium TaxID=2609290 RepID=UPI00399F69FC
MASRKRLNGPAAGALVAILAAVVLAADQFTKYLALENLPYQREVPVLGDFFQLYLTKNPGAAFSLGTGVTWLFTLALAAVAVVVIVLAVRSVRTKSWAIVLGLLLGGVLGNLTDRLLREPGFLVGHVIDFIHTPWMWLWFPSAIYNVADMFIVTMMISVAVLVVIGIRFDGSRERRNADESVEAAPAAPTDG